MVDKNIIFLLETSVEQHTSLGLPSAFDNFLISENHVWF
jgi:hypothetical protein